MPSRAVLVTVALCFILLAAGIGAASSGDGEVTVNETNDSIYIETDPCEGNLCWLLSESYDLYINGDHETSLEQGEKRLVDESMYEDDTVEIAVTKKQLYGDSGWAFLVERNYPEEESESDSGGDRSGDEQGEDRASNGNESTASRSPPDVIYNITEDEQFDDCISEPNWRLVTDELTEEEYCFEKTF